MHFILLLKSGWNFQFLKKIKGCEARISTLIQSWRRQFKFKCFACHSYFLDAQQLSTHDMKWCQLLHNNEQSGAPSKVFLSPLLTRTYFRKINFFAHARILGN